MNRGSASITAPAFGPFFLLLLFLVHISFHFLTVEIYIILGLVPQRTAVYMMCVCVCVCTTHDEFEGKEKRPLHNCSFLSVHIIPYLCNVLCLLMHSGQLC